MKYNFYFGIILAFYSYTGNRKCSVEHTKILFFYSGEIENGFTHVVWDSAEAMPNKLKTTLFSPPDHVPITMLALLQGNSL